MPFVYRHYRLDTREVFYVGIGSRKDRHNSKRNRNSYWNNIVNKHGFSSEIIADDISREEAKELEIFLIQEYGRKDNGTGCLVNMTDGGEGINGVDSSVFDKEKIKKRSNLLKKKFSDIILDIETGVYYIGLKEAAKYSGMKKDALWKRVSNRMYNDTKYRKTTESGYLEPVKKERTYKSTGKSRGRPLKGRPLSVPVLDIYTGVYYKDVSELSKYVKGSLSIIRYYAYSNDKNGYYPYSIAEQNLINKRHNKNFNQ